MERAFVKNIRQLLLFILFLMLVVVCPAQTDSKVLKQFEKARKYYFAQKTDDAIKEAEEIIRKEPEFVNSYLLLADIYFDLDSTEREIGYLEKAHIYSSKSIILYRLAKAYHTKGMYEKAITFYKEYLYSDNISTEKKEEVQRQVKNCDFSIDAINNPVQFEPKRLSKEINSTNDEYWPSLSVDQKQLVFTRLLEPDGKIPHEDFYISNYNKAGWGVAQPIVEINTSNNEGAQSLSVNGKFLLFTACNRPDGYGSCDIYYSKNVNGKWTTPKNAGTPVNTRFWETQPSFSSDNRYLYFTSNRSGGKGGKDIWRAEFLGEENGKMNWGEPENLGDSINTKGNENSPFIHANNRSFYFASDYRVGIGGFDLFTSDLKIDGTFSEATNLGYPINTPENEQGLNISADGTTAFFSSARNEKYGLDIYTFELEKQMRPDPVTYANIKIADINSGKSIQAKIELMNLSLEEQKRSELADENGEALVCFPLGANYAFNVSEPGYLFYSQSFKLDDKKSVSNPYGINIKLVPIEKGAKMDLYNIYFEIDSFRILRQSVPELQNLVKFLTINRGIKIEIQGHTDSTGDMNKNQKLSEARARAVLKYLVEEGIKLSRLEFNGYGQNSPVATNTTKKGRQMNRRTTIIILEK